ncbi:Mor transcription activator family protein [Avibacterium paragallinarum]|uniref:Mor transcription activator family protein n=1 Tax=Avibacterium TaxID=292486 RepID=UPI00397CC594
MKKEDLSNYRGKWATILGEIIDVFANELKELGESEENAIKKAQSLAFKLGEYFGGKSFYLPFGSRLKVALRDNEIYHSFTGDNLQELVKKFHLSESHIYSIIRNQRKLNKERRDLAQKISNQT